MTNYGSNYILNLKCGLESSCTINLSTIFSNFFMTTQRPIPQRGFWSLAKILGSCKPEVLILGDALLILSASCILGRKHRSDRNSYFLIKRDQEIAGLKSGYLPNSVINIVPSRATPDSTQSAPM